MEISYQYTKIRSNFGRQPIFCEHGPEMCDSIPVNEKEQKLFILRNPVHQPTQNTPSASEHVVNTIRADFTSSGANHAEGGWPKDVNVIDPEATQRYRRKVEKDDGYIHCVQSLAAEMEHYVLQNNAVSMYETYYTEMSPLPAVERNSVRTVNCYRDLSADGACRPVSAISWHPDGGHTFAVCYVDVDFNRIPNGSLDCYIWDLENANSPLNTIQPPFSLLDIQYNPRDNNVMAGGLISGQVALWDRRKCGAPVNMCPPHVAHRDLVRNVLFLASKSGQEFFSSGPDGCCKWWDCRNLSDFTEEMIIDVVKSANDVPSMANSNGISVLEFESTIPTRFMVGTENGYVFGGNRKGKTALDKLPVKFEAHVGPVWALKRNPGFLKNFLTVGDWTARVWSEDCKESAVLWSPPHRHKITDGAWSPTRLSLMLLTQWNGVVSVWDLLRRQHQPVLAVHACDEPLLKVVTHDGECLVTSRPLNIMSLVCDVTYIQGSLAALGSRKGNVYMVDLSPSLTISDKNDKGLLTVMLEREAKRERILEARLREIRLKMRQAEEGSPTQSIGEPDPSAGDRDLAEATAEYLQAVKKELAVM